MPIKGPFTAHVRLAPHNRYPNGRVVTITRKTFVAAERYLDSHQQFVMEKWITNAGGIVHSQAARKRKEAR